MYREYMYIVFRSTRKREEQEDADQRMKLRGASGALYISICVRNLQINLVVFGGINILRQSARFGVIWHSAPLTCQNLQLNGQRLFIAGHLRTKLQGSIQFPSRLGIAFQHIGTTTALIHSILCIYIGFFAPKRIKFYVAPKATRYLIKPLPFTILRRIRPCIY